MKKLIIMFAVCLFAVTGKVSAQNGTQALQNGMQVLDGAQLQMKNGINGDAVWTGPVILTSTSVKEGQNSMLITKVKGTLQFTKKGDKFSNVSFKDSAGVVTRLVPTPAGTQGAPKPECKDPLPDACFGTANKNIGLCMCKPGDLSAGYTMSFYYVKKHIANVKYNSAKN